jgi:hypothetical protein
MRHCTDDSASLERRYCSAKGTSHRIDEVAAQLMTFPASQRLMDDRKLSGADARLGWAAAQHQDRREG